MEQLSLCNLQQISKECAKPQLCNCYLYEMCISSLLEVTRSHGALQCIVTVTQLKRIELERTDYELETIKFFYLGDVEGKNDHLLSFW